MTVLFKVLRSLADNFIRTVLQPFLVKYFGISLNYQAAIVVVFATALYLSPYMLRFLHKRIFNLSSSYRKLFRREEKYCGCWIEKISKAGKIYGTKVELFYQKKIGEYCLSGIAYDESTNVHANFHSSAIKFSSWESGEIEFLYSGNYKATGRPVKGWSQYVFHPGLASGHGWLVDFELDDNEEIRDTGKLSFDLFRVDKKMLNRTTGKRHLSDENIKELIVAIQNGLQMPIIKMRKVSE